ncbi:MAG: hypothetical protein KBF12_12400 [Sebaldella sp.]|nr:hypothetical protein [Sebaldella sp.]
MKKNIIILVILMGIFTYSDNAKENIKQEKQEITIDYRLFSGSKNDWWSIYNDTILNEMVDISFKANGNFKTAQKNLSTIQSSFGKNKALSDISSIEIKRIGVISDDIELSSGEIMSPDQLEYKLLYSNDLLGKINVLSSNRNYKLDSLELQSKWLISNLTMTMTKLYGYYVYLNIEEKNLKERIELLTELEKLEELKISLKRGNGDGLLSVKEIKGKVETLITQNNINKKLVEKNLTTLLGNDKNATNKLLENIRKNPNVGMYDKMITPDKIQSDSITQRADISYYLIMLKEQNEKIAVFTVNGYPNFWIKGDTEEIKNYEEIEKFDKIGNSYYFQRYNSSSDIIDKKVQIVKEQKDFIDQYNSTIIGAFNDVNKALANKKKSTELLKNDNTVFDAQKGIMSSGETKLNAGTISKYEYYKIRYNYLTQDLYNLQLRNNLFIQKINLVYSLGGTDEFNRK